ncbi:Predicted O-methyltransferase YrrM [Amphibacillus marinus]|uniref:tRNA 5-hydroxyuridine methyltransferase n=1 Tax=Amphibacillus marinus TaxID=872970 RepID=A0A1H8NX55_9BACI|nr:O-methyltransferase [Amphibacillus marinus]SEO33918.1 Predicted O-methyltransferase YrrM [Amphibacillus marinus]
MLQEHILNYLTELQHSSSALMTEMEQEAIKDHVPIMERDGIDFLKQLVRIKQPQKILEIGTAIGYSALQMQEAFNQAEIVTVERDEKRAQRAQHYIAKAECQEKIDLIQGDALECVNEIKQKGPFDLLFIDAAKGQYQRFFNIYTPMLQDNGIIITDNVLFKGYVAHPCEATKRIKQIAEKIASYNEWLINQSNYNTTIVPVGDGIAITTKRT